MGGSSDKWVVTQCERALDTSLQLANRIYYWWSNKTEEDARAHYPGAKEAVLGAYHSAFRRKYEDAPQRLCAVLSTEHCWAVRHLAVQFSDSREGGNGFEPKNWIWLGNLLLRAASFDKTKVIPQLACLLVDTSIGREEVNEKRVEELFPNNAKDLMTLLAVDIDVHSLDQQAQVAVLEARKYAGKWLAENASQEEPALEA